MIIQTLAVTKRDIIGTGKLNALRALDIVPGIIYGPAIEGNINIQFAKTALRTVLNNQATDSFLLNIELEGKTILTLVKAIQRNFLTDNTAHLDFLAVAQDTIVNTKVAIKLTGSAIGIATGGVLHQIVHELPIKCAVKDIPDFVEGDMTNVEYKSSLRMGQITLPAGITTRYDNTVVLASIIKL